MNISTYEARIAALEAQLGPGPGPSAETGLLSVIVTPDIGNLNDTLSNLLPLLSTTVENISINDTTLQDGDEFTVTVTPGSKWYATVFDPDSADPMVFGEQGQPYTKTIIARETDGVVMVHLKTAAVADTSNLEDNIVMISTSVNDNA